MYPELYTMLSNETQAALDCIFMSPAIGWRWGSLNINARLGKYKLEMKREWEFEN